MAKGNPKAYLNANKGANSPVIGGKPDITDDENAAMIEFCLESFSAPIPDLNNPDDVFQAVSSYFKSCIDKGFKPGNMGLYARLNVSRQEINDIVHGRRKINPASADIIKKALKTLSQLREMWGATGKLNPVTMIFWQKNYDGLTDTQTIEVSARDTSSAEQTPEEIAAALEADVIQDN